LTTAVQGPDSTLYTVTTLSQAARQCLSELREDLDSVIADALTVATDNGLVTELPERRPRKVSRRLDSCAEKTVVMLSPLDELKREMLMDKNTTSEQLRDLIETLYPDFADADVVVSQFNVVRRLQPWTDANTLQQRALACPPNLVELRKMYQIMIAVPVTSAECERTFSKLAPIKNKMRTSCGQDRLEKLLFCSVERDIVQQIDAGRVIGRFDGDSRRLSLK